MSRAEVERIVGGPPGDYRIGVRSRLRFIHGNSWPTIYTWEGNDGRIEVKDGEHGFGRDPVTGGLRSWSTSRGGVDWVCWYPTPAEERGWDPAAALVAYAAGYFGLACFLYFGFRAYLATRVETSSDAASPAEGGGRGSVPQ
jgi:hypothetical protein